MPLLVLDYTHPGQVLFAQGNVAGQDLGVRPHPRNRLHYLPRVMGKIL